MLRYFAAIPALALGLVTAAVADTPTPQAPAEKQICRRETPTGSYMSKKVCRTKAQWDAIARAMNERTERHLDGPALRGPGTPGL